MVKIVTVTKTLNEARNIESFCLGYAFADLILVADGGSADRTVDLARQFSNVRVRAFTERVQLPADPSGFMNPEPRHLNFCIDWAKEEGADWIILDGCDCWPNPALQRDAREILESTQHPIVSLDRLYLWGIDEYFPKYNVGASLWAWQPAKADISCAETTNDCFGSAMIGIKIELARVLEAPYCCLHYCYPDEATVKLKMQRYAAWGHPQVHPLRSIYAPPVPLPGWACE